jgi:hypothetical protein
MILSLLLTMSRPALERHLFLGTKQMSERRTPAGQIWSHLPSADPEPPQRQQPRLADVMYPDLVPQQPKPAAYSDRESLLRNLRELNRRISERLAREGRR